MGRHKAPFGAAVEAAAAAAVAGGAGVGRVVVGGAKAAAWHDEWVHY